MGSKLFVGNLDYRSTEQDLRDAFSRYGDVVDATVVQDRDTGRSRGFGFVEFGDDGAAQRAISELDGTELNGRSINVSPARERTRGAGSDSRDRNSRRANRW